MRSRRPHAVLAAALVALASALVATIAMADTAAQPRPFDAKTLGALKREYAGHPFVLSFWSIHCEPCREEMPLWRAMRARFPGVPIVLVQADPPGEEGAERFLARDDPGPVRLYRYADEFEERIRYAVDPRWRGELPRNYFFDATHRVKVVTGVADSRWCLRWFSEAARAPKRQHSG